MPLCTSRERANTADSTGCEKYERSLTTRSADQTIGHAEIALAGFVVIGVMMTSAATVLYVARLIPVNLAFAAGLYPDL